MPESRRRRTAMAATVLRTERLSASLVRVVVGGPGLDSFKPSPCADSYVKAVFVHEDAPRPFPLTSGVAGSGAVSSGSTVGSCGSFGGSV